MKLGDTPNGGKSRLLPIYLLMLLSPTVLAASFDCEKSTTSVEKKICANPDLSALDDILSMVYRVESEDEGRDAVQSSQKLWLKDRNRCTNVACIKSRYEERIINLCEEGTRVTGGAIGANACASVRLDIAERKLGDLELKWDKEVISNRDDAEQEYMQQLITDERKAWRAYRNAKCTLYGAQEGGAPAWQAAYSNYCMVEETEARIKGLNR